jgi:chromosome segregation ATPase
MDYKSLYEQQLKENEELKEQRDKVISLSEQTIREIKQKYQEKIDDIAEFAKELQNDYKKHIKEIEELKKENDKLKKEIIKKDGDIFDKDFVLPKLNKRINELEMENAELEEANEELKKISNVKTDLINELFSKMVQEADIDDGISISKEYGNKYIDEWNKIYEDIIKDTIKVMNECELDDDRVYLQFHACDCIEFCVKDTSEEEETDEEN